MILMIADFSHMISLIFVGILSFLIFFITQKDRITEFSTYIETVKYIENFPVVTHYLFLLLIVIVLFVLFVFASLFLISNVVLILKRASYGWRIRPGKSLSQHQASFFIGKLDQHAELYSKLNEEEKKGICLEIIEKAKNGKELDKNEATYLTHILLEKTEYDEIYEI